MHSARVKIRPQAGLTLIELLVVLIIIAILAISVQMLILPLVLGRARDAKRFADLNSLERALNSYSTDKGFYPPSSSQSVSGSTCALTISPYGGCMDLQGELLPYLGKFVFDPLDREVPGGNIGCVSAPCYMYGTSPKDHINYCLCTTLEGIPPQPKTNYCSSVIPYGNYCITNSSN